MSPTLPPTEACARAMRDAGIDAMAALDTAVAEALEGLTPEQAREVKLAFGHAMSDVMDRLINPAIRAFPALKPDEAEWRRVAQAQAQARAAARVR